MIDDKTCLLIVDDDNLILSMLEDYFKKRGYFVYAESSGEGALARIIESKHVDLIITDIMMARMDGWQLLDYIRNEMQLDEIKLPVIVMSAVESIDLNMEYIRHKANDWINKPIKPMAKLLDKVENLTGKNLGREKVSG